MNISDFSSSSPMEAEFSAKVSRMIDPSLPESHDHIMLTHFGKRMAEIARKYGASDADGIKGSS